MLLLLAAAQDIAPSAWGDLGRYLGPFVVAAAIMGGAMRYLVKQLADRDQQIRDQHQAALDLTREVLPVLTEVTSHLRELRREIERMDRQ